MPQGTQLACGRERPRICLPPRALPPRILNTQDPINQGPHFSRGLRTTVVPIAGTQLWLSLPTHRHSLRWQYHHTSCGCYSQLINFCLHNEDKWHSYPFTPKFPSSQAGPVPQRTHNTAGSLFRKWILAHTVMGFLLLSQDFFHIVPCLWFFFLLFKWEEWILGIEWGVCRLCDTNLELQIQRVVSAWTLLYSRATELAGCHHKVTLSGALENSYFPRQWTLASH